MALVETRNTYIPGDLLWTKVGKYPFWPCMVVYKPDEVIFRKSENGNKVYFVQFFGKKPYRGWTASGNNTFPYKGIAKFPYEGIAKFYDKKYDSKNQSGNISTSPRKKKKTKHYITRNHLAEWRLAVQESEEALSFVDTKERFKNYVFDYSPKEKDSSGNGLEETELKNDRKRVIRTNASKNKKAHPPKKIKITDGDSILIAHVCYICSDATADCSCYSCNKEFHFYCLGLLKKPDKFKCWECELDYHRCDSCKKTGFGVLKCSQLNCFSFFHPSCLEKFETAKPKVHSCPLHTCLTCYNENPKNPMARKGTFLICAKCPSAYHNRESCIPAGSIEEISATYIICSFHMTGRNRLPKLKPCNVTYCVLCEEGGALICCDGCPNAYHQECLNIPDLPDAFYCEDCCSRKQLCYDMIVWCKFSRCKWWPAKITHPSNTPNGIKKLLHCFGEFPVKFYGTYDFVWTHRGRVINYEFKHKDYDSPAYGPRKKPFQKAVQEAHVAFEEYMAHRHSVSQCGAAPEEYKAIKVNRISKKTPTVSTVNNDNQCACKDTDENPCGTNECLNRSLLIECKSNKCQAGEKCQNQRFQKKQYKSTKVIKTNGRGWGLSAAESIKKGEFIIEYVGEIISHQEYRIRSGVIQEKRSTNYYFLYLDSRRMIDAGPMGNKARFINHSCEPNSEMVKWLVNGDSRIGIFALKDITPGEELSFNYASDKYDFEQTCLCGSSKCKGFIGKKSKDKPKTKKSLTGKGKLVRSSSLKPKKSTKSFSTNLTVKRRCTSNSNKTSDDNSSESSFVEPAASNVVQSGDASPSSNLLASPEVSSSTFSLVPAKSTIVSLNSNIITDSSSPIPRVTEKNQVASQKNEKNQVAIKREGTSPPLSLASEQLARSMPACRVCITFTPFLTAQSTSLQEPPALPSAEGKNSRANDSSPLKSPVKSSFIFDVGAPSPPDNPKIIEEETEKSNDESATGNPVRLLESHVASIFELMQNADLCAKIPSDELPFDEAPSPVLQNSRVFDATNLSSPVASQNDLSLLNDKSAPCLLSTNPQKQPPQPYVPEPALRLCSKLNEDNHCFVCKKTGSLVCCDKRNCPRAYHAYCVGLRELPEGDWFCPWHSCSVCDKHNASILCANCPTSFCKTCFKKNALSSPFYCQICDLKIKKKK